MNPLGDYLLFEKADSLLVVWRNPTLPVEIKFLLAVLLVVSPLIYFYRVPAADFADRHLHLHWKSKSFGLAAVAFFVGSAALLLLAGKQKTLFYWTFDAKGISAASPSGRAQLGWTEIESAAYDTRNANPDKNTLVLSSKNGKTVWLPLSLLDSSNRKKVLSFIRRHTENRFPPAAPQE